MTLHGVLESCFVRFNDRTAIEDAAGTTITYRELDTLSGQVRDRLLTVGVRPGDRVGVHLPKSIGAVASVIGILRSGAAYVPVDADAPLERAALILGDCAVAAVFTEPKHARDLSMLLQHDASVLVGHQPATGPRAGTGPAPVAAEQTTDAPSAGDDALAYILYTSGSTGRPKGVMLTHRCALSYIEWCTTMFRPRETDRFSSHAPLHFDLSILDLYLSLSSGATLVLIDEELGKDPRALAPFIAERRITVWYSVPSVLALLARYGRMERHDYSALRLVLFAGEVFPLPQLQQLRSHWPEPAYYNLYGPTETNVCTYHRVPDTLEAERTRPLPIGRACEHVAVRVVDEADRDVPVGMQGELVVSGPAVMIGYWNLPEQNAAAFLVDDAGTRWYRTGDLVVEDPADGYLFHGRRDRMVKRRGYRIELGEIEAGLALHPAIREVAVIAHSDAGSDVRIKAYISLNSDEQPSLIELKQFSVDRLPRYMAPDTFDIVETLPRTSTDKIDYRALAGRD